MAEGNELCGIPPQTPVLVTGATGFTGSNLIRKLAAADLDVRAIARQSSNVDQFNDLPITWFRGDVYDEDVVNEAAKGVAYIFHVAAAFRAAKIPDIEYARVHVVSTQLLAKAAVKNPNFKRFVHVSTMGVHGHIENPPGNESSPFSPGDPYQVTKAEAEIWFREFAKKNGLPFVILRPTGIYGPGDRRLLKIFRMSTWPIFPILGKGKCLYHLIHVDDLTNVILSAAVHPRAAGEAILVGNPQAISLEDMASIIAAEFGQKLRIVRVPVGPFFVLADFCEAVCKPLRIEPPIYRRRVAFYTKDRCFDTSKMRELLGYHYLYTNESGLKSTARWYREQGWVRVR